MLPASAEVLLFIFFNIILSRYSGQKVSTCSTRAARNPLALGHKKDYVLVILAPLLRTFSKDLAWAVRH